MSTTEVYNLTVDDLHTYHVVFGVIFGRH
ncbi:hypothetical protein [Thermostaphylospora chromogena]